MSYTLNLPEAFINANKDRLDTGVSNICILGGSAVRNEFSKPDYVVIPSRASITFVEGSVHHKRRLAETGTRNTLIVRVRTRTETNTNSASVLANMVFGTGGQQVSMSSQFGSCSTGKINFVPASRFGVITNGVTELLLNESIADRNMLDLLNPLLIGTIQSLGYSPEPLELSNVIFCMPYGTIYDNNKDWLSFAYTPGPFSYFNNGK